MNTSDEVNPDSKSSGWGFAYARRVRYEPRPGTPYVGGAPTDAHFHAPRPRALLSVTRLPGAPPFPRIAVVSAAPGAGHD